MKKYYSIGETAQLNNISVKTLRYYDEIDLLKPALISPENGYRYYEYSQFSFIDKIKRYKSIGMSLKDLKALFQMKDLAYIEQFLEEQKKNMEEEQKRLDEKRQDIQWMTDFFEHSKNLNQAPDVTLQHRDPMYVIKAPCDSEDSIYTMDLKLREVVTTKELENLQILNPYGYILDFQALIENRFTPLFSTVCIRETLPELPKDAMNHIICIPGGTYLCCKAPILSEHWNVEPLIAYCQKNPIKPALVIALEYLNTLYDPYHSPYEIKILLDADCEPKKN